MKIGPLEREIAKRGQISDRGDKVDVRIEESGMNEFEDGTKEAGMRPEATAQDRRRERGARLLHPGAVKLGKGGHGNRERWV